VFGVIMERGVYGVGCVLLYWWRERLMEMEWIERGIGVARGLRGGASGARTSLSDWLERGAGGAVPGGGRVARG
jgi:hypothetical protein